MVGKKTPNDGPTSKENPAVTSWSSGKAGMGMGGVVVHREADVWVDHRRH